MSTVPFISSLREDIDKLSKKWRIGILIAVMGFAAAVIAIATGGASFQPLIDFYRNGVLLTERQGIDLIEGAGINISINDFGNRVGYTVTAAGTAGAVALDLGNTGTDESLQLIRINTSGDTNSIFTETPADELLINLALAWPLADALAADPTDCSVGNAALGINASGTAVGCFGVYTTIDDEGTPLVARRTLNFIGAGVSCVDDPGGAETDCTVTSGGSQNLFETFDAPSGTDPVADSPTDTLQILVTGTDLSITGDSTLDTLTFDILTNVGTNITADLEEEGQINSTVVTGNAADDQVLLGSAASALAYSTLPDCNTNNMLTYTQATNTFGCDADDTGGGAPTAAQYIVAALDATLTAEKLLTDGVGIDTVIAGGDGGSATINFDFSDAGASPGLGIDEARFTNNLTVSGYLVFEGDTADAIETRIAITNPTTTDKTFTIPDANTIAPQSLSCTNQFFTALNGTTGALTCTTATLASAQFANQGTTTTVLHGNAAGNPSFGSVVAADLSSGFIDATTDLLGTLCGTNEILEDQGASWVCIATPTGTFTSFNIDGDNNSPQTITNGEEALFAGGTNGIDTVASATDTITFNLDTTEIASVTFLPNADHTWTFDIAAAGINPTIAFAASSIEFDSNFTIDDELELRLKEEDTNGENYVGFKAPAAVTSNGICSLLNSTTDIVPDTCVGGILADELIALGSEISGILPAANGGTGDDTSALTGVPRLTTGNWTYDAGISHLAASSSADLLGVLSDETGGGLAVFGTNPTFADSITLGDNTDANRSITWDTLTGNFTLIYDEVTDNRFEFSAGVDSTGNITATIFNADTGFQIGGAAASGSFLRGNATNFVSSTIQVADLPAGHVDALTDFSATLCATNQILEDQGGSWACIATPTSGGGEDLQATYDLETAPALITITDALGGIQFNGDAETVEATLTILDDVAGQIGILIDNDDEISGEDSPILRLANSTVAGGDTQYDFVVTATDLEIRGDDGVPDLSISTAGNIVGVLDITATTIAGITSGNLVDLSATETITGAWSFVPGITLGDNTDANRSITWDTLTADNTLTYDEITDNRFEFSASVDSTGEISSTTFDADTGYQIANAAASGNYLRGNGTNFVSSTIQVADLPAGHVDALTDLSATLCGTNQILEDQGGSWACINTPTGTFTSFDIDGDNNSPQTITNGNEALFVGGDGVITAAAVTDQITFDIDLNATLDGVGSTGNLSGFEFTATSEIALLQGCTDNQILKWDEAGSTWSCDGDVAGGSGTDLQGTYDNDANPVLIILDNTRGGIIIDGDAETGDPIFTLRQNTESPVGLLIDNDDSGIDENSPQLLMRNSRISGQDGYFMQVSTAGTFLIRKEGLGPSMVINGDTAVDFQLLDLRFGQGGSEEPALTFVTSASPDGTLTYDAATDNRFEFNKPVQIDTDLTLGDNTDANRSITWDTLTGDFTLIYDEVTDNRFEFSAALDVVGNISATTIASITSTNLVDKSVTETISGAWIFTGSLEVPNGAGGTLVDVAGEVTVDTTSETFNYHDGTEERVVTPRYSKGFFIENPIATDDFAIVRIDETSTTSNITLLEVCYLAIGGTNWIGQIQEGDANGGSGVNVHASDVTAVSGTNNCTTSFSNAGIDNGDYILIKTASISGTPTSLHVTFYYDIDP